MARDAQGNWINPKDSGQSAKDRYLESKGLLNYQTKGQSAQEIAQKYAQAGVRTQGQWFKQNYGQDMPDPVAQPQVQINYSQQNQQGNAGSAAIQGQQQAMRPMSPDERQEAKFAYVPAPNGLVVKAKYQTAWLNGDPSLQAGADPNQPLFASVEQVKAGQANWTDVAAEERKRLLADPTFYKSNEITKFDSGLQQQILADPNFNWDKLPKWQKMYFELSSSPAGMGAVQGALMGMNKGAAVAGAALGWAGAKSGYDQNKEFWKQNNVVSGAFGLFNFLAEQAEKTIGLGVQAIGAAQDPNVSVKDVFTKEGYNAGASTFEILGAATPGWYEDGKKLMEKVNTGESLTWRDFGNFLPGVEIVDALINPEQHKGREYYLGAAVPVELQQTIYERFNQAREEIKAGRDYREVMTEMQTGIVAQISDMASQSQADPLNVLPKVETKIGSIIAEAGGNEVAATAFRQSEGLGEAASRYKALVQTGQALTIDPNFKVDQMGMFSRFIAGINEQGQVKAGGLLPTKTGLLDPVNVDKTSWVKSMIEQTPQSRAQTGANMFYENVSALLTTFEDPHEAGKYLKALANSDMETWAQLGTRFAESPEFYTVLPALKEFNTGKLDAIVAQWDLSLNNRDALTRLSNILGVEPAKWLEDAAKRGTYEQDFQRLKERVSGMNTPEARAILKDIDAGVINPEFLKQTVDLFTGEGALPWHPGQWKAMVMDTMGTHFDEWVTKRMMLDKSPEAVSAFYRTTALMKQAQSILLLGGSPGYAITNGLSNMVNRAITGIYGYMTPNQINSFIDRMGLSPARFEEGVGIGGQVEQAAGKSNVHTEEITKAVKGKGPLTTAKENLAKLSRGMPMSKLSGWFESVEGKQGFAIAMQQFWSQSWRRGVGFSSMSADMVNTIKGMGIAPERIYAAIEAGMNQTEIEKALFGRFEGVQARSLINDAAQKTGLSAAQAADMLEKVGVLDTLDTYLKGQTSKEGIQAAFTKANRVAQDFIEMQTGEDLKAIAESVKQRVGVEGAASALDVVQKAQASYTDAWLDHYFRFGEVMNDLKLLDDPAQRSRAIDFNYEVSDGEFRRVTARNAANYKGIFDAWGMSNNPAAMNVLAAIGESDVAMANAYRSMREIRKGFFDKYRNDWENVDWDEWDANNRKIDSVFKQAFAEKKKAEIKQAAALGNIYESLYGPAAGEAARLWWEDVVAFNDEMVTREQDFRASLADMDKDQKAAAKQQFYSETKRDMIVEMDRINADGIARLERVIKRGNGGGQGTTPTKTPPQTPPTPLSPAETSPQIQSTNLEGGDAAKVAQVAQAESNQKSAQQNRVDEFNALMAAAEQRKAADAKAIAEHVDAVWEVASEYWAKGGNYERGVLGAGRDKFALMGALRKPEYGGISDLKGIEDPRLTPEIVRQVLENRKAYKEAAGNSAATQAISDQPSAGKKWDVSQINEDTSLLRAIALHGGIDLSIAKDLTGEKTPKSAPGVFTRKGVNIDEMARMLADDGYPIDLTNPDDPGGVRQATELISRARAGNAVYPVGHDFNADAVKAEAAYYDGFENIDSIFPPADPALWQTEFETAVQQGDLTKIWGMIGDYPDTFEPSLLDEYIRMADETAARVEAEGRDLEVAQHMARAEEAIADAETRAEAVTTRQMLKEKFAYAFGLSETQAQAYMELSDAAVGHFAKITGESPDALYSRYYADVVKVEGEQGTVDGLKQEDVQQKFKHYEEGQKVNDWEVSEDEYVQKRFERERRKAVQNYEGWTKQLEEARKRNPRANNKDTQRAEFNIKFWEKQASLTEPSPAALSQWRRDYIEITKKAISTGQAVPFEVIAQYPEFTKARDARARYDKGRNTSFANRSIGVDDSMQAETGYKIKRQDGKPMPPEQAAEIRKITSEVEQVIGPLKDLFAASDITIAHTNGKHPFMKGDASGMYHPSDKTVSVGTLPHPFIIMLAGPKIGPTLGNAGAHELGHWLDFESGKRVSAETTIRLKSDKTDSISSLAEADAQGKYDGLIRQAMREMNDTQEARKLFMSRYDGNLTPEQKELVNLQRNRLTGYWNEPREIWARLFEQYIATKLGDGDNKSVAHIDYYEKGSASWSKVSFEKMMPQIEAEIQRRLEIMRGNAEVIANKVQFGKVNEFSNPPYMIAEIGLAKRRPRVEIVKTEDGNWQVSKQSYNKEAKTWGYEGLSEPLPIDQAKAWAEDYLHKNHDVKIEQPKQAEQTQQAQATTEPVADSMESGQLDMFGKVEETPAQVELPVKNDEATQLKLFQQMVNSPKGAVTFDADGIKATIHAFESGDFSTLIHENGHVFRRMLSDVADRTNNPYIKADLATIEDWAGVKDGAWDRAAEEKFARGFEKYITDGKAPTPALVRAFESFKGWMLQIYKTITGSAIDVKLTDDVRRVFDRMLGAENLKVDMDAMLLQMNYDPKLYYVNPLGIPTLKAENFLDGDSMAFEALKAKAAALKARVRSGEVQPNTDVSRQPSAISDQQPSAFYSDMNFNAKKDYQNIPATVSRADVQALSQWTNEQGKGQQSAVSDQRVRANLEKIQANRPPSTVNGPLFQTADPVDSPAFQNWFGDSKVVDENGNPLVVYHGGSNWDVVEMDNTIENALFMAENYPVAVGYADQYSTGEVKPLYVSMKNPLDLTDPQMFEKVFGIDFKKATEESPYKTAESVLSYYTRGTSSGFGKQLQYAKENGYDGLVIYDTDSSGKGAEKTYVVFEKSQVKLAKPTGLEKGYNDRGTTLRSEGNRGTFDPADPNILFQEANQPFGAYDAASGFHPQSEVQDQGWAQHVRPLMDAMQEGAINQLKERPMDGATRDMSPEGQKALRQYMKKVQGEMATTKLATVRWGEKQRDFAMLNYNKRYGLDRVAETVFPYQFYQTRSMATYAARILDKPAMFANYARLRNQQNRYERDIPERLRGKIKINAPWLPEWMGGGLYIDPSNLFFPAQMLKPFERAQQDKNYQTIETERIMQEWAADGRYSQADIAQAAQSQSGTIWERANAEAKIRRESETANPLDFFSSMFGPAWYLSTPLNLAGVKAPGIAGTPSAVSPTPLGNTSRAIDTVTDGTWAEPVGNVLGLLGKFEDWGRGKLNLPTRGEYGEYYTKRQVANMVAEGLIDPEQASLAMIEKSGQIWDEAAKRVDMELAMRVPGMSATYAALHSGPVDGAKAFIPSLFGAGLLPAGELEYRGLKQEWNDAWKKADAGDKTAITNFFEEHPEYEAYLAKGKDGDELLKSFLIGQIWDGYMELGTTNQKQARAEMGDLFAQSFLDKETRSYETLDIETLTQWARMLNKKTPQVQGQQSAVSSQQVQQSPKLDLYSPSVTAITDQFFEQRKEQFPNYYEQQAGYYALPKSERAAYLRRNPDLKKYWDWKDGWYSSYPQYKPIFNGQAFKTVDTSTWPPALEDFVRNYAYTGKRMPSGAYAALQQVWITEGQPMGDFETWVDSQVVPAMMYQGEGQ